MTAQLVLQFEPTDDLASFDDLIRFEEALILLLGKTAVVDGHDFGSDEMNIFILTNDPVAAFALVQQTDVTQRPSQEMRAAYRLLQAEDFTCLWPPGLSGFRIR